LPLRETFPKNIEEANQVEFGTGRQIYDIILSELNMSLELLPEQFISGVHHPSYQYGRANKIAASFLKMRVNFLLGDFDGALQAADQVINSGYYNLNQDPIEAFSHSDPSQGNEVIWYALYYDDVMGSIAKVFTSMTKAHYTAINGGRGDSWSRCPWNQFCMSHAASKYLGWMDENLNVTDEAKKTKDMNNSIIASKVTMVIHWLIQKSMKHNMCISNNHTFGETNTSAGQMADTPMFR
jgi:starch-binding outer membrane protein, SusD/RagB family